MYFNDTDHFQVLEKLKVSILIEKNKLYLIIGYIAHIIGFVLIFSSLLFFLIVT